MQKLEEGITQGLNNEVLRANVTDLSREKSAVRAPSLAQRAADFIVSKGITISLAESYDDDLDRYSFLRTNGSGRPEEIGTMVYNTATGEILRPDLEEMLRRVKIQGFVAQVIHPFRALLEETRGDFSADAFDPIHEALDKLERKRLLSASKRAGQNNGVVAR